MTTSPPPDQGVPDQAAAVLAAERTIRRVAVGIDDDDGTGEREQFIKRPIHVCAMINDRVESVAIWEDDAHEPGVVVLSVPALARAVAAAAGLLAHPDDAVYAVNASDAEDMNQGLDLPEPEVLDWTGVLPKEESTPDDEVRDAVRALAFRDAEHATRQAAQHWAEDGTDPCRVRVLESVAETLSAWADGRGRPDGPARAWRALLTEDDTK